MPVTLTWTGHATFLIDTGSGTILVDPFFDECPTASMKAADVACDAILITHGHFDHVADAAAIAKRTGAKVCAAFEIANWLGRQGVDNVQPMNFGGTAAVPGGTAAMELAFHSSSLPDGSYGGNPAGWLLDVGGKRIYVAGDTGVFSDMARIGRPRAGRRTSARRSRRRRSCARARAARRGCLRTRSPSRRRPMAPRSPDGWARRGGGCSWR